MSIIKCDFCNKPAEWDAPTTQGPWAHMCVSCCCRYGRDDFDRIGSQVNKHSISGNPEYDAALEQAWLDDVDLEEAWMFDSIVPTACPDGCEVEPDGRCCHGYSSPLLLLGLI